MIESSCSGASFQIIVIENVVGESIFQEEVATRIFASYKTCCRNILFLNEMKLTRAGTVMGSSFASTFLIRKIAANTEIKVAVVKLHPLKLNKER
jgi:hypothetical protein